MKRFKSTVMVLTGLCWLLAAGLGPATGQASPSPGDSSPTSASAQPPVTPLPVPLPSPAASTLPSPSPQQALARRIPIQQAAADDIRDIRGPLHIPNPMAWLYYAIGALLAAAVATGIWRWFKRHQVLRAKRAYEIAFERLEQAKALMQPELADAFSVAVSNAVRGYIEQRFGVRVTRHTTEEFLARIQGGSSGELAGYRGLLQDFLVHCDLAKFARCLLTIGQMEEMHRSAWDFVDRTRPRPEKAPGEQQAEASAAATVPPRCSMLRSVAQILVSAYQRVLPKKTMADAGLGAGSAVAAGGR